MQLEQSVLPACNGKVISESAPEGEPWYQHCQTCEASGQFVPSPHVPNKDYDKLDAD